jgi:hypothetical protein
MVCCNLQLTTAKTSVGMSKKLLLTITDVFRARYGVMKLGMHNVMVMGSGPKARQDSQ